MLAFVFAHSTLGYEAMAKGIKVAVLPNISEKMRRFYKRKSPFGQIKLITIL